MNDSVRTTPLKPVLLIEDDLDIREALTELLRFEGYAVETAENGKEALEYLRSQSELPGLILLDMMMPIMDGSQFRREQKADKRLADIPTIVMSADNRVPSQYPEIEPTGHLRKPINIEQLFETVKRYCC